MNIQIVDTEIISKEAFTQTQNDKVYIRNNEIVIITNEGTFKITLEQQRG